MRPLLVVFLMVCACGQESSDSPEPETPPPTEPEPEPIKLIEAIARPPILQPQAQAEARRQALEGVDLDTIASEPAVGDLGLLVQEIPELDVIAPGFLGRFTLDNEIDQSAPADEYRSTLERLFHREPSIEIREDGTGVARFSTLRSIVGASLYFGTVVPQDALGLPRHRKTSRSLREIEPPRGRGLQVHHYEIDFDVKGLLKLKYDVAGTRRTGRGVLAWRLEVLDAENGTSRVIDFENAFSCSPLPCEGDDTRFVQLPSLRLGPFVDLLQSDSVTISFTTDAATRAVLLLFAEGVEPYRFAGEQSGTRHEISISDLEPGTRYRYQPLIIDHRGEVTIHRGGTFETPPEDPEHIELVVLSDSRSGAGAADEQYGGTNARILRGLMLQAFQRSPQMIFFVGDLIDGYTTSETSADYELRMWQRTVMPFHAQLPIYEVMGNHEALIDLWATGWAVGRRGERSMEALFAQHFINPTNGPEPAASDDPPYLENTYSFDLGPAHFAVINSNYWYRSHPDVEGHPAASQGSREGWVDDATLAWLDEDLGAAREAGRKHLFVFTHEPAFPNGGHLRDAMWWDGRVPEVIAQRNKLCRLLGKHEVRAIFNGDEHNYSRTLINGDIAQDMDNATWQLISGGAGAPYYAREADAPWADNVRAFDPRQHFIYITVDGESASAEAISLTGERIDSVDLTRFQ